jgi:hypothetical protein
VVITRTSSMKAFLVSLEAFSARSVFTATSVPRQTAFRTSP